MTEIIVLALLLVVLLAFTVDAYYSAKAREADEQTGSVRWRTMDAALTDSRGVCWVCQQTSGVLELVDHGQRFELACLDCAHVLKKPSEAA